MVKGVIIYNQEKTYSGLENQRRYWGGGDQRRGGIGGLYTLQARDQCLISHCYYKQGIMSVVMLE